MSTIKKQFFFIISVLLLITPASASILDDASKLLVFGQIHYYEYNESTQTATVYKNTQHYLSIKSISNTSDLTTFTEIFRITSNYNYDFLNDIDFGLNFEKHKGKYEITSHQWFLHTDISYNVSTPIYGINSTWANRSVYNNITHQNETEWYWNNQTTITGYTNTTANRTELIPYTPTNKKIEAGQTLTFTQVVTKPAEIGVFSILLKPVFLETEIPELTWWNGSWSKKVPLQINNTGNASVLNYYQINLNVTYNANMNNDFSDIRFYNESSSQNQPYWIDNSSTINGSYANVWINVTSIPASSWLNNTIYMYYGNAGAASASNGANVFINSADVGFDNSTGWTSIGAASTNVANSKMTYNFSNQQGGIYSGVSFSGDWIYTFTWVKSSEANSDISFGFYDFNSNQVYDYQNAVYVVDDVSFYLYRVVSGSYSSTYTTGLGTGTHYVTMKRIGNNIYVDVYSDADRTTSIRSLNGSIAGIGALTYLFPIKSHHTYSLTSVGSIDSAYVRKYVATEPTITTGAEELTISPPAISTIITGNFYINTTWTNGTGAIIDSYNSTNGTIWINNTLNYRNTTLSAHAWQNLTIYAYNNTVGLSLTPLINNTQIPNNPPILKNVSASYYLLVGETLSIDANYTDIDTSDTITFATNSTKFTINPSTGIVSWSPSLLDVGLYNWRINATDNNGSVVNQPIVVEVESLGLNYPVNNSTIYKIYPPTITTISFNWSESIYGYDYHLMVARDINFNLISVDITTPALYSNQSLDAGSYWAKIQFYNITSGAFLSWSNVTEFRIVNNQTVVGNGIQGTVHEIVGTSIVPLNGATVFISNESWSSQQITGTNGYFLFQDLKITGLYYLRATRNEYQTTDLFIVNVTSGMTTRDIPMKQTEPTDFESNKKYVSFYVKNISCPLGLCGVSGATVNVYEYGNSIASKSGTTDSSGYIVFQLYKTKLYRVQVIQNSTTIYDSTVFIQSAYDLYELATGSVILDLPNTSNTNPNASIYQVKPSNKTWSITNLTNATLKSDIGLGMLGQGIMVGIISWATVSAGGIATAIALDAILVYLGLLSYGTMFFFALTALSLWYITRT